MTTTERQRKISALQQLMRGNAAPARSFKPPMVPDLTELTLDELEQLAKLQRAYMDGGDLNDLNAQLQAMLNGREIRMIPQTPFTP